MCNAGQLIELINFRPIHHRMVDKKKNLTNNTENKNLCGRDGRTICGPQCVPKSNLCHCNSLGGAT